MFSGEEETRQRGLCTNMKGETLRKEGKEGVGQAILGDPGRGGEGGIKKCKGDVGIGKGISCLRKKGIKSK